MHSNHGIINKSLEKGLEYNDVQTDTISSGLNLETADLSLRATPIPLTHSPKETGFGKATPV